MNEITKLRLLGIFQKVANNLWFICHLRRYKKFCQKVEKADYNKADIWYNYKMGFFCMPPITDYPSAIRWGIDG